MYSRTLQNLFESHNISVGDSIQVRRDGRTYTGVLMPRSRQGDRNTVVIKLDNGYNLGIRYDDTVTIEQVAAEAEPGVADVTVPDYDPDKPDIVILHTGGTIASKVSYEEGGVKPAFEPEDLLAMYPELFEQANVESEVVAQMLSEDMEPAHWVQIAEAVAAHRDADGIIIGHGTDTMHYTSAALSFMLENIDLPVVLVGAQRSSDRPSSDAALNLLSAVRFIEEQVPGVYICMHETVDDTTAAIHPGTRARKMHTSRRDAFQTIGSQPLATVDYQKDDVVLHTTVPEPVDEFALRTELDARVGLIKTTPGFSIDQFTVFEDYAGVVIEGSGLGHLPVNSFDEHTEHHEDILAAVSGLADDAVVVMSSQCINGRVNMNVYDAGVKIQHAGVISAGTMTPETAYVKLMWALGQTSSQEAAIELFHEDVAGELLAREEYHG